MKLVTQAPKSQLSRPSQLGLLVAAAMLALLAGACEDEPVQQDASELVDTELEADADAEQDTDTEPDADAEHDTDTEQDTGDEGESDLPQELDQGELELDDNPGDSEEEQVEARCGDAVCDPDETAASCPNDCGTRPRALFIDDQDFVIPSNAELGDTVGHAKPYPTLELAAPHFAIIGGNEDGLFGVDSDSGLLFVALSGGLVATSHELEVELASGEAVDTALMRIRVVDSAQVTFIDPSASASGADGSREHPLTTWPARVAADGIYMQRRGSVWNTTGGIELSNGSLLGAYGSGARPHLSSSGEQHLVRGYRTGGATIRDLQLEMLNGTSLIYFNQGGSAGNVVDNCELHGAEWAIRMTGSEPRNVGHRVVYTELYDIGDDGMYMQNADQIELGYLEVHHVNTNWQPPTTPQSVAAGDGLQFVAANGFHVHHSVLDRSDSGNKFCLIAAGSSDGVIEHNLFSGPLATPEGGSSLYFGNDSQRLTVRFNTFHRGSAAGEVVDAVYMHAPGTRFHGNIFHQVPVGIGCRIGAGLEPCELFNNVFFEVPRQVVGGQVVARNNIFWLGDGDTAFSGVSEVTQSDNLFSSGSGMPGSLVGEPLFVDAVRGDFRLQAASPAIDTGADLGLTQDRAGTPLPQGAGFDMGAYEFVP